MALPDHDRIIQVLANLLSNAIKFSDRDSRITATVAVVQGAARCPVNNPGPAIPAAQLEAIFERSWQGHAGLGLGLYISRCILQSHGGLIRAECAAASGTTFFFTLPLA
jgi:signal transduction histidine kinase